MIVMLFYSHIKKELSAFTELGHEISCRLSEDDWDFPGYSRQDELRAFLEHNPIIDIACVDVVADGGIDAAEHLRRKSRDMYLILLSDATVSPAAYIKPTIMAGSLLIRPLTAASVKQVFTEAIREYIRSIGAEDEPKDGFLIENREIKRLIPYSQIVFFESRNKKVYINTGFEEYAFYDTLDDIESRIGDGFVRCHRSYIVSKSHIKKVMLSQNTVLLDDDYRIPLSRSYKSVLKELR
ncbi:LytR/AlgR family response regulator transcription factor [Ruminococcus sp.]|uniref:LytR/AlgR family response regulator transcription factor n=1 Tax=Ruminococcus sp. TaxID=41978 RepID=UPI00388E7887